MDFPRNSNQSPHSTNIRFFLLISHHFSISFTIFPGFPSDFLRFFSRSRPWLRWPWPSHEASWLRPPPGDRTWIKWDDQQQKWRASLKNSKHLVFQLGISPRWRFIAGKIPNNGALLRFFWQKNTCNKHGGVVRRENQRFLLQGDFPASHFWWHRRVSHF